MDISLKIVLRMAYNFTVRLKRDSGDHKFDIYGQQRAMDFARQGYPHIIREIRSDIRHDITRLWADMSDRERNQALKEALPWSTYEWQDVPLDY